MLDGLSELVAQAVHDKQMSQLDLMALFGAIWTTNGTINPTVIAFTTPGCTGHMNVLYDLDSEKKEIGVMEPWYQANLPIVFEPGQIPYVADDSKFTGARLKRRISYYKTPLSGQTGLFIGYPQ